MPDPYYDPSLPQNQIPLPQYSNIPTPADQMAGYNYLMNNQMLLNQTQSTTMQTLQMAQYNFHQHMASALQGTMAAGMAVYGAGKSITDKAHERQYNDMLLGGGNYVMERSAWRDAMWGFGIAQSDIGRAMKIGGRRPEFVTGAEYQFQAARSWDYRKEEMMDMLMGGGATMGASALGMAVGGPMGFVAGTAVGIGLDATLGQVMKPIIEHRKYRRDINMFTDMADLNRGIGQRRMSREASGQLADQFFEHDHSKWLYVPIIGESLAKRIGPEVKYGETFKKMASLDLFRDISPDDIEKISSQVKKTAEVIDKYAGLMHTTRDAVLQMKGSFRSLGMNDTQQNMALSQLGAFTLSTGMSAEQGMAMGRSFIGLGQQFGYFNTMDPRSQQSVGLMNTASIVAAQNAGLIWQGYDPGTLSQQQYANAANFSNTGWGRVLEHGGGNVGLTAAYYGRMGGGNVGVGMALEETSLYGRRGNPLSVLKRGVEAAIKEFGFEKGLAVMLKQQTTQEGRDQVLSYATGLSDISENAAAISATEKMLQNSGRGLDKRNNTSFRLGDAILQSQSYNKGIFSSDFGGMGSLRADMSSVLNEIMTSPVIEKTSGDIYYTAKRAYSDFNEDFQNYYQNIPMMGGGKEIKEQLITKLMEGGYADTRDKAINIINNRMRTFEKEGGGRSALGLDSLFGIKFGSGALGKLEKVVGRESILDYASKYSKDTGFRKTLATQYERDAYKKYREIFTKDQTKFNRVISRLSSEIGVVGAGEDKLGKKYSAMLKIMQQEGLAVKNEVGGYSAPWSAIFMAARDLLNDQFGGSSISSLYNTYNEEKSKGGISGTFDEYIDKYKYIATDLGNFSKLSGNELTNYIQKHGAGFKYNIGLALGLDEAAAEKILQGATLGGPEQKQKFIDTLANVVSQGRKATDQEKTLLANGGDGEKVALDSLTKACEAIAAALKQ